MLLLCSSLSFLSLLVCSSRFCVRSAEGIPAGFSAETGSTLPACLLLLVALSVRYIMLGRSATLSDATVEISQHVSNT